MIYVRYSDLVRDSLALARKLPRDTIGVLGIPRSGMLPATIIATELGVPLGTVAKTFAVFLSGGRRMEGRDMPARGTVVVVDDSVYAGGAMNHARDVLYGWRIGRAFQGEPRRDWTFRFAAPYVAPGKESAVDYFSTTVEIPRLYEWNWKHNAILADALCDMDGVICTDPDTFDDDGEGYAESLTRVQPLHVPVTPLKAIVTGRLERYREVTERWLAENGVRYGELIMAPFEFAAERRAYGAAQWKATVAHDRGTALFIESDHASACFLADTGLTVLCPTTGEVLQP